jgi:hypothetical protein
MRNLFSIKTLVILLAVTMVSCDLFESNKTPKKEMSVEDAKVEIRAANQEISSKVEQMVATPAMGSLNHLSMMVSDDMKSAKATRKALRITSTYLLPCAELFPG